MAVLHPDVKEVAARKNAVAQARASVQNGTAATNTTIPRQTSNGTKIKVDLTPKKSAVSAASLIDTARENVQKSTDTINSQQTRRNMLRKISEQQTQESEPEKWFSGDTPTSSEIQARIYNISKTDSARAEQLYSDFERYQADPSSPIYNPYTTATSKAVSELGALGYDVSNFDSSWLESNASLMNSYRTSTGTTPLAPSSSSTAEQDAAYWYYKAYSDEQTTQKAEQEWQALQDEITYWTNRTDRNYSDDEILAKIDWSNYKTLTGMDESAAKGTPTQLTRSVGYSQDALKGVIWAARNNGGTNDGLNSVRAALGQGNQWTENMETAAKLDPTSDSYSPYSVSSTMDDAALYFGVSEFSSDWCAENRDILAGDDETAKKYYTQIYNAEQTTEKAESELEQLSARIDRYVDAYDDPEKILTYLSNSLEDDFPTLAKMDKGMASGDLVSTTRAVGYSWNDIKQQVEQKCTEKSNAPTASSVIENTMGVTVNADQTIDAISGAAKTNIQEATDLIDASGTEAEKHAAANPTMSTATANASVIRKSFAANALKQVESTISPTVPATANAKPPLPAKAEETAEEKPTPEATPAPTNATAAATATATDVPVGTHTEAQEKKTYSSFEDIIAPLREHTRQRDSMNLAMMNVAYQQAENYAAKNYQSAMQTTKEYEAAQAKAASAQAELDKMLSQDSWVRENLNIDVEQAEASYAGNETALEMLEVVKEAQALQAQVQTAQENMSALSGDYEQAQDVLDNIARTYTNFHNFNNYITEGQAGLSMLDVLDVVSDFSGNYQTNYYTTTPVEQMVENGESGTAAVQHVTESAQNNIDAIDAVLAYIDEKGIQADDQTIANLKKAREENEQYLTEAEYYQLRNKEDFASTVDETKTALYDQAHSTDAWMPTSQTAMDADWTDPKYGTTRLTYVITGDNEITPYYGIAQYMTQGERDTYTYLYATQGQDAAKEYYNDLASTVLTVRQATEEQESWEQAAEEHPILSSAISILASPLQSFGTLYSVAAAIKGEEINPYDSSFAPSSLITTVRSTVKGNIDKGLADNQFIKVGANMLYDAAVSAGESALNTVLGGGALSAGVTSALAKDGMGKLATFGVKALSSLAGAAPMGVQAAGTAMRDVKLRGGTNNQALAIGAVTFVAETGTEAITFDNIQEAFNAASAGQAKSFLKTLVGSALEEAPGEMVNELVEGVADEQIMGDLSSRKQTIDEYRAKGYTKEEATKKAYVDFAKDILYAGVVGAISGGMSSGASYVAGKVGSARTLSTENAQTDVSNALDELTNGMLNTNEQTIQQTQQESPAEAPAEAPAETVEESTAETAGTAQEAPASAENGTQEETSANATVEELQGTLTEAQTALEKATKKVDRIQNRLQIATENANQLSEALQQDPENTEKKEAFKKAEQKRKRAERELRHAQEEQQQQQTKVDEANRAIEEAQKPTETTEIPTETTTETAEPTAQEQEENDWAAITARLRVTNLSNALLITDQTYQTALIADALNNDNGNESTATLAAEELTSALGVNKAVGFISDALNTWANNPMGTFEQLQQGIINTIMAGGEKISAIQSIAEAGNGITFEQLDELLTLTAEEQAAAQVNTEQKAHESRTANRVIELIGDGALTGLRTYQSAVVKAQQNLVKARSQAERTEARVKACGENLQTLTAQFNENPTDASLSGFVQQAIKDLEGAVKENTQAKETLETRQRELTEAKDTLKSMQEQALAKIRQQAVQEVGQQEEQEAQEAVAQSQQNAASGMQNASIGASGVLYTTSNEAIDFHYAVVDANSLIASNDEYNGSVNPAYPAELQPRDRTRVESIQTTQQRAQNLNPERLGASTTAQDGAPVVGADGVVESGNGRVMAIRLAMQQQNNTKAQEYTNYLRQNAQQFGIDPNSITDNSILVRVRDTDVDRVAFARQSNESLTNTMSDTETATSDANALTVELLEKLDTADGNLDTQKNTDFMRAFLNEIVPASERGRYLQENGRTSYAFLTRVRNALFMKAYGSINLTNAMAESTDNNVKNVIKAMTDVSGRIVMERAQIEKGNLNNFDIGSVVAEAAERFRFVKAEGLTMDNYLNQVSMFETESDAAKVLMRFFDEKSRSAKGIRDGLNNILNLLEYYGNPNQLSLVENVVPSTMEDFIERGLKYEPAQQMSFDRNAPQADAAAYRVNHTTTTPALETTSDSVLSGDEITRNMEAVTNIPIDKRIKKYERNLRKITRGYAYPIQGTTHLKDASNVGTACHEYGHVFDERYGLQAHAGDALIDQMVNNITSGNNYDGRLAYMAYTPEQLRGESIAEFTRLWMQDRDSAIRFASQDLVDYLESSLKHDGWLKGMQQARVDWQLLRNAQAGEVAKAQVALTPTKKARSKYQKGILGLWTKLMDRTTPLASITDTYTESKNNVQSDIDYSRDPRTIALAMSNHVRTFTESCLVDNMVDAEGNIVTNESGEAYGSLSGIMERNNITEDLEQDFNAYLLLRHAQYRQDAGYMQSNGMDVKAIFGADVNVDEALRQLEAAHPEFRQASDDLYAWYEKFVQTWVIDTHASDMTQDDFDALRSLYPCYVPTYRANMSEGSGNGSNINSDPGNSIFRRATGGTTQVYNPVMGLVENIQNYIAIEKQLESYRAFAQQLKDGNVDIGIAEFAQPDMEVVDNRKQNQTAQETLVQTISEILKDNPDAISSEAVQQLTTAMDALPERSYYFEETASGNDVLNFRDANGKMVRLTLYDKPTAQALTMVKAKDVPKAVQAVGAWTRFLCAMSTSLNVGFAGQNILSDSETAMSTMKAPFWKKLAPTFIGQQLNSARMVVQNEIAARTGHEVSEDYRNFKLFGEMDSRYALRENKTQREVRQSLYANRKGINLTNVSNVAKAIITSPVTTVEALTDLLENTTRYTAWRADNERSETNYSTKLRKGQNAREATVDFSKSGSAEGTLRVAKMVVPFLGASMQGINKTATMFTNQNKGNRASTAAAIVCNSLLTNLVMAAVRSLTWDDDEQEAYDTLSDYEKNKYWHIKVGEGDNTTFVRLKRSQDAIVQAVDAVGTYLGETLTGYEGDSLGDLMGCAQQIASNLIPSTSFVWNGVTDALNNQTWYGSDIEGYTDQQKPVTQRYDEDTTEFSKGLSVLLNGVGVQLSPLQLDYILQQYTGSLGQIGMDLMSNATNGTLNAESFVDTLADRIGAKFVIDPASSNGLTSNFYDGYEQFTQLTTEAKQDGTMSLLRASLTQEEANAAVEEAVSLTSKGGALYEAKQTMNDLWKEYNSVLENENMTKEERNAKARKIRQEINKQCVAANLTMGDFWNKYGYNNNAVRAYDNFMQFITGEDGNTYTPKTSYEQLPQIFLDDADTEYMQAAKETWEATGSDVCLPHPPTSYTQDKVKVELSGEDQTLFNATYRDTYRSEFLDHQGEYKTAETDEEKKKILQSCHTKALNAAKKEYKSNHLDAFKQ